MSSATSDRDTQSRGELEYLGIGVASSTSILAGVMVCYNASGYIVDGADTSGLLFAGVSAEAQDNSTGANGDLAVKLFTEGQFKFASSGLARTSVGKRLYLVDNQTVGLPNDAGVDNFLYVGRMAEYISATECWVDIEMAAGVITGPSNFTISVPGVASGTLNLSTAAAALGGTGFYVVSVSSVVSYVTAGGAINALRASPANYSVAAGAITLATSELNNTLVITFVGYLR